MMRLVIAEKPSVARAIALSMFSLIQQDGYFEGEKYIVSWCLGHLLNAAVPDDYDPKYKHWHYEDLPIVPDAWKYTINPETRKQFEVVKQLMHDERITEVICATDAGREGELIFRLVYQAAGCKLPVKRLWISSLENEAIRKGFAHLKDGRDYDNLYRAALCRDKADWLIGMNATRLFSLLYGRTLRVGRVMSPTLAMIVNREDKIRDFQPETFYTVQLQTQFLSQSGRISGKQEAERIASLVNGQTAVVERVTVVRKQELPPQMYDLTSLQRDANRIYGYTAQQTLDLAQSLYERRMITYPRTDSRFLTHDMEKKLPALSKRLTALVGEEFKAYGKLHPEQVINDQKVTDHHAIIPTGYCPNYTLDIPVEEIKLLILIGARALSAMSDPFIYEEMTVTTNCAGVPFTAKGRRVLQEGWKFIPRDLQKDMKRDAEGKPQLIPESICEGNTFTPAKASVKEGKTTPPKRFTDVLQSQGEKWIAVQEGETMSEKAPVTQEVRYYCSV